MRPVVWGALCIIAVVEFWMHVLGSGGYGKVVALDKDRVCKIQYSSKQYDPGVSTAALREMVALTQIGGVQPGRMLLDDHGTSAIEIKRFDISLLDWMGKVRRAERWELVPMLMGDVVGELFAAHSRGYIHRDVKPENVMLDLSSTPPRAHLIDWGMSRNVFEEEAGDGPWTPGQTTIWYRAPELFTGDAYGTAADMWALGILLIELITGKCPFRGRTELAQLQHYIDVLGPPPADKSVLPKWRFARAGNDGCGERAAATDSSTSIWESASPSLRAFGNGIGVIIDGLIRWDPAERTTARALTLHPLFANHHHHPHPHPHLARPMPISPLRGSLPLSLLKHAIRTIILPVCIRCNVLEGMVMWTAARFVARVLCVSKFQSRSHLGLVAVACVDLANKMVGTQVAQVLRRMRVHDAVSAQVSIVNGVLGISGLAEPCEVFMLRIIAGSPSWHFSRDHWYNNQHSSTHAARHTTPMQDHSYQIARAIMDSVLILNPRMALTRLRNERFLEGLLAVSEFAAFGRRSSLARAMRWKMDPVLLLILVHCTNHVLTMHHTSASLLWSKLHPQISLLLRRDRVVRKRLVSAFLVMRKGSGRTRRAAK